MASGQLLKTTNHLYFREDLVACGSTCEVYKGYNKLTGEQRALKILNIQFSKQFSVSLQRETEALLRLQHPNIVTFYSVEKENLAGKQVLVTEFCSGGTLSNFLKEPENYNGLSDEEFLIFFHDIVCGMKHLRKNGFVHRDIKPPNILRCQNNRKTVYKLTDFGTAKPLQDEEEFMSLVGTVEYLHPDIYEAVYFQAPQQSFTASADLWSLGATLYHSASGLPPFIPFGGRDNHVDMFQMLTNKESGVVSGIQKHPGGDIEWSKDLPEAASMSNELESFILPMIAGMLEKSPREMWTFDKFFLHADEINKRIHIKVLDTSMAAFIDLYMKPTDCCIELAKKLEMYSNIKLKDQRLFYEGRLLSESLKPTDPIEKFTAISLSKPIILICNQPFDTITKLHEEVDELPEFGPLKTEELQTAAQLCEIASRLVREAKETNQIMKQLCKTSKNIRLYQNSLLDQRTILLTGKKEWFFGILSATGLDELSQHIFEEEEMDSFINVKLKVYTDDVEKTSQLVKEIKKIIDICDNHANDLQKLCTSSPELQEFLYSKDKCFHKNRCCNILTDLLNEAKDVMNSLISSNSKRISYSKAQFKDIEKKQLFRCVKDIVNRVTKHCFPINENIFTLYQKYHKDYLETDRQLSEMYEKIKGLTENIQELNGYLPSSFMREVTHSDSWQTTEKEKKKMEKGEKKRNILKKSKKDKSKGVHKNIKTKTNARNVDSLLEKKTDDLDSEKLKEESNELSERLSELNFPTPYQIPDLNPSDSENN